MHLWEEFKAYKIVLASKSPRRQQLLSDLGLEFEVCASDGEEIIPDNLSHSQAVMYLAKEKASHARARYNENDVIVIAGDTLVCVDDIRLGKPANAHEAVDMLSLLNNRVHQVYSGLAVSFREKFISEFDCASVRLKNLSLSEIEFYVEKFSPYDKAGAYGIQEWIGLFGIDRIEGSFFTIMGMPTHLIIPMLRAAIR